MKFRLNSSSFSGSLHPNVDKMLEKFIRGKEYQSAKYEEARGVLELRFGIVCSAISLSSIHQNLNLDQYARCTVS